LPGRKIEDRWVDNEWLAGLDCRGLDIHIPAARRKNGRRTYVGWVTLAAYAVLLVCQILRQHGEAGIANTPLWELQDSRQLLRWIGELVLMNFREFLYFVPVGLAAAMVVPHGSGRLRRLPISLGALAVGGALTVLVYAVTMGRPWRLAAAAGLMLPLLGCLLGTWMGATWLRGRRACLWFLPKVALLVLLGALVAGIFLWLSLERAPLPFEAARVTSEEKRRLVSLVRSHSPRSLDEGQTHTLRLTEHDINVLLAWGLALGSPDRKAKVSLARDSASLSVSLGMPLGTGGPRYLNMVIAGGAEVEGGVLRVDVEQCRLGAVEVPRWLVRPLVPAVTSFLGRDRRSRPFLEAARWMTIEPGAMEVTYGRVRLPPGFREDLFGPAIGGDEVLASTRAQVEYLLAVVGRSPQSEPSFGTCMETVFALARERSAARDPVIENQAGIFALGVLLGHPRIEEFVGDVHAGGESGAARQVLGRVGLRGRSDWTRHFWVSAAIAILSNVAVSDAAGLLKEELDADTGGSGFSFADLLADRAGTTFAICATRDEAAARAMQDRLAGGFRVEEFFPPADDLPEGLSDADLQRRYGGVGGQAYHQLTDEMERRIAGCAAYR